jgi:hypothetical protein
MMSLKCCALAPHREPDAIDLDPVMIPARRGARFFNAGGLCERYERIGDELIQFHDIFQWILTAQPNINKTQVIDRFLLSVKHNEFGRRGAFGKIDLLVDLDNRDAPAAKYSLRPYYLSAVEARPLTMRARCSTWAAWLRNQGWPLPNWLSGAPLIDQKPEVNVFAPGANLLEGPQPRSRGRVPETLTRVMAEMRAMDPSRLGDMKEKQMKDTFSASRDTCRRARNAVMSDFVGN